MSNTNQELDRKRKLNVVRPIFSDDGVNNPLCTLHLYTPQPSPVPNTQPPAATISTALTITSSDPVPIPAGLSITSTELLPPISPITGSSPVSRPTHRRKTSETVKSVISESIPPPFPWSTNRRATVYSLKDLVEKNIHKINGRVQCKRCEQEYMIEYNVEDRFNEVRDFIAMRKSAMHDRAPSTWMNPALPACSLCQMENSVKPLISNKKKSINWLFLLLGQMLGCCTLEQLKYFCKHTRNHRTGAKDRVLYLAYLGLCKQLEPDQPLFNR